MKEDKERLWLLFAQMLEYPTSRLSEIVADCETILAGVSVESASLIHEFAAFAQATPLTAMEEIFTKTFDLEAVCFPYIGYQLFGEDYRRGIFLARLKEQYLAHGFSCGSELPDHIGIVLRYLANGYDEEFNRELVAECFIPALEKIAQSLDNIPCASSPPRHGDENPCGANPYQRVIMALKVVVGRR